MERKGKEKKERKGREAKGRGRKGKGGEGREAEGRGGKQKEGEKVRTKEGEGREGKNEEEEKLCIAWYCRAKWRIQTRTNNDYYINGMQLSNIYKYHCVPTLTSLLFYLYHK